MNAQTRRFGIFFGLLAAATALVSIFSAVLMTEPGQSLNLPRDWTLTYYRYRWWMASLNLAMLISLWVLNERFHFRSRLLLSLASIGVVTCLLLANYLIGYIFSSEQYGATYVSVAEADHSLSGQETIYAVEINGEVRGYPREHMRIPHVAGATIGGEDVVMTFCALSNLPVVYDQDFGQGKTDLEILAQTHNNLTIVDRNSGEVIQQITGKGEFSDRTAVKSYPNEMMSWNSFKTLHPDGKVFIYAFDRSVDQLLLGVFEGPMERQFSEEHGPIFPTLDLADTRLPNKEQIWGIDMLGSQAAFTRSFLQSHPVYPFELGDQRLLIVYDAEHGIVSLFEGPANDVVAKIAKAGIDSVEGLNRLPIHNGVFWMVWAHWFPETIVFS